MSLVWGLPLGLLGLAALLLPVLLHLDRRRTLQTLRFAALRWIGSAHPPRRHPRLTEWLLLVLRLLLLASVALWLAQPLLRGEWRESRHWLVVVPGVDIAVDADAVRAASEEMHQVRWLAPGFPAIDRAPGVLDVSTSSLLRELDAQLGANDTLRVLLPERVGGLDSAAITLSRQVEWRIAPASTTQPPLPSAAKREQPRLVLWPNASEDESMAWLQAAITAWSQTPGFAIELQPQARELAWPEQADAVIVIDQTLPEAARTLLERGATVLHLPPAPKAVDPHVDQDGDIEWPPRAQRVGNGTLLQLQGPLQPQRFAALHESRFALQLRRLLFGEPPPPAFALAADIAPAQHPRSPPLPETPLRPWLAILIAVLFLIERLLASGRRLRGVA